MPGEVPDNLHFIKINIPEFVTGSVFGFSKVGIISWDDITILLLLRSHFRLTFYQYPEAVYMLWKNMHFQIMYVYPPTTASYDSSRVEMKGGRNSG